MNHLNIFLTENESGSLFLSILSLLLLAHFLGHLFEKLSLPKVIGEISAGLFLGISGIGGISSDTVFTLFNSFPEEGKILSFIYWVGLILLMFTAGFKIQFLSIAEDRKMIFNLLISATIFPLIGGYVFYQFYDFSPYLGSLGSANSMLIIVCVATAITSIPVISKIFLDLNIIKTRFAKIILATATLQDLILWMFLGPALHISLIENNNIMLGFINSLFFLITSFLFGPKIIKYVTEIKINFFINASPVAYLLSICLVLTLLANVLNVNLVFGALMAGIIVGTLSRKEFNSAKQSITDFSMAFFIPLYFAIVGLKIDLLYCFDAELFFTFLCITSLIEIGSVYIGMRLFQVDPLTSLNLGVAMNARGGPGIVMASLAYEASIINQKFFVSLVLVAIVTSLISGSWFKFLLNLRKPLMKTL